MEDVSLDTQPTKVASEGHTDVSLAASRQTYGGDNNPSRVKEASRFCRVELSRSHGCLLGEIMDGIDIGAGPAAEVGRSGSQIGGAGLC